MLIRGNCRAPPGSASSENSTGLRDIRPDAIAGSAGIMRIVYTHTRDDDRHCSRLMLNRPATGWLRSRRSASPPTNYAYTKLQDEKLPDEQYGLEFAILAAHMRAMDMLNRTSRHIEQARAVSRSARL